MRVRETFTVGKNDKAEKFSGVGSRVKNQKFMILVGMKNSEEGQGGKFKIHLGWQTP